MEARLFSKGMHHEQELSGRERVNFARLQGCRVRQGCGARLEQVRTCQTRLWCQTGTGKDMSDKAVVPDWNR